MSKISSPELLTVDQASRRVLETQALVGKKTKCIDLFNAYIQLAQTHHLLNNLSQAGVYFAKALKAAPQDKKIHCFVKRLFSDTHRAEEAQSFMQKISDYRQKDKLVNDPFLFQHLAHLFHRQGDQKEAQNFLVAAAERHAHNKNLYYAAAAYNQAARLLEMAPEQKDEQAVRDEFALWIRAANSYLASNRPLQALDCYTQALWLGNPQTSCLRNIRICLTLMATNFAPKNEREGKRAVEILIAVAEKLKKNGLAPTYAGKAYELAAKWADEGPCMANFLASAGEQFHQANHPLSAKLFYTRAIERYLQENLPRSAADSLRKLAQLEEEKKLFREAATSYIAAAELETDDSEGACDYSSAARFYCLANCPEGASYSFARAANLHRRLSYYEVAAGQFEAAARQVAENTDLFYQAAECHALAGNYEQVISCYLESSSPSMAQQFIALLDRSLRPSERFALLANCCGQMGEHKEEAQYWEEEALQLMMKKELSLAGEAFRSAGDAYQRCQHIEKAITSYSQAAELFHQTRRPIHSADCYGLAAENCLALKTPNRDLTAQYYERAGQEYIEYCFQSAIECFHKAREEFIRMEDKEGRARCVERIAFCFYSRNQFLEAIRFYDQIPSDSIEYDTLTHATYLEKAGDFFLQKENPSAAIDYFEKAYARFEKPEDLARCLVQLAQCRYLLDDGLEAARLYKQIPSSSNYYNWETHTDYLNAAADQAQEQNDPSYPNYYQQIGDIYFQRGDSSNATKYYEKFVSSKMDLLREILKHPNQIATFQKYMDEVMQAQQLDMAKNHLLKSYFRGASSQHFKNLVANCDAAKMGSWLKTRPEILEILKILIRQIQEANTLANSMNTLCKILREPDRDEIFQSYMEELGAAGKLDAAEDYLRGLSFVGIPREQLAYLFLNCDSDLYTPWLSNHPDRLKIYAILNLLRNKVREAK